MQDPLVSIVIPVYNGSNFMREAIDSALAQTYSNIEILVVNDGSTDDTREIALSYGDKIRYFEKENGGVATALNLAIREMKGAYFSWLSHDDWYTPDKVEAEIEALRKSGNMDQVVSSDWDLVRYPSGEHQRVHADRFGKHLARTGWFATVMWLINGCALLIPKAYFDIYGGFDENLRTANDGEKWFQMFKNKKFVYVNKSLVRNRIHGESVTSTYDGLQEENDKVTAWMMKGLQSIDVEKDGINLYQLYSLQLAKCIVFGLKRTQRVFVDFLKSVTETEGAEEKRKKLREKIYRLEKPIYVMSAQ